MQILLYLGGKLQSLIITMSSCVPCSTGSSWVEITRHIRTVDFKQSTNHR